MSEDLLLNTDNEFQITRFTFHMRFACVDKRVNASDVEQGEDHEPSERNGIS